MAEEGAEADSFNGRRKQSRRERFRDRLLKTLDKADKPKTKQDERDENLDDFLKSDGDTLPIHPSPSQKPIPRLSVSSSPRWPGAHDTVADVNIGQLAGDQQDTTPALPPRPRRRKGLSVRFSDSVPQIIGEGGDEAEAPTIWISRRRQAQISASPSALDGDLGPREASKTDTYSAVDAQLPTVDPARGESRPRILVRAPTGLGNGTFESDAMLRSRSLKTAEYDLSLGGSDLAPTNIQPESGLLLFSKARLDRTMLEEEARTLTSGIRRPSPERPALQQDEALPSKYLDERAASSTAPYAHQGHSPNASSTHLSPYGQSPSTSRPSSSSSQKSMTDRSTFQELTEVREGSKHVRPPKPAIIQRKPLPRPTTAVFKEDALGNFRLHARRYHGLFVLSAENTKPGVDASLSRWVRAAGWWFLTAETNFKLLRKDVDEGLNILQLTASRRHMQAMVDLAKTIWIVEDIVQEYAKTECLDLSTAESVEGLIQSNPLSRFARTLQYWQDLSKQVGGLVASACRNGFLTSTSESQPLSPGIDSTIWINYPVSASGIDSWFRSANPSWVEMDDTVTPIEPLDLAKVFPLKSTSIIFRIRSMFCHTFGGFQSDHQSPKVPCILTIGRHIGSYALVLFISSQDHSINVVIETDPVRGDGMAWLKAESSVLFSFADEFQFGVQLQPADYVHLKELYDLAVRASTATLRSASARINVGERSIFRCTTRTFERRSSERDGSFPYAGEQKDCEIILFEKFEVIKAASTTREARRGLRLSVVLSASASNLGVLDVHLGGDKPILLHSAHEYNPPLVEIMESQHTLLLIQFSQSRDFNKFYELLASLDYSAVEKNPHNHLPLHSFSIEPTSLDGKEFLKGAAWRSVHITRGIVPTQQSSHATNTLNSPDVNICSYSSHGNFANRLSQGMYTS